MAWTRAAAVALLVAVAGCAPKTYVVLLENDDGHASQLTFNSGGGTQTLTKPGQATGADARGEAPVKPFEVSADEVKRTFAKALTTEPLKPLYFTLTFVFGTAELTPSSKRLLPDIVAAMKQRPVPDLAIVGHADNVGAPDVNYRLALDRAQVVSAAAIEAGIDPKLIEVTSHGANDPAVPARPGVPEERNRRVEVIVR